MTTLLLGMPHIQSTTVISAVFTLLAGIIIGSILMCLCVKFMYRRSVTDFEFQVFKLKECNQVLQLQNEFSFLCLREKSNEINRLKLEMETMQAAAAHCHLTGNKSPSHLVKGMINFQWLGLVPKNRVSNLTQIKGIGLWVEEKLMSDIFTSEQVSKLIPIDVETNSVAGVFTAETMQRTDVDIQVCDLANKQFHQQMN